MDVTVRRAVPADARAVATAHVRGWQVAYDGLIAASVLDGLDVDQRTDQWRQNFTESHLPNGTPAPTNLVAEVDGHVVGFACIGVWRDEPELPHSGELWAMYVHPDDWGTGAGYALMCATFDLFQAEGVQQAYLWVLEENARARQFYERQGWRADDATRIEAIGPSQVAERRYSIA